MAKSAESELAAFMVFYIFHVSGARWVAQGGSDRGGEISLNRNLATFLAQTGAAIAAFVLNIIALTGGLGYVDLGLSSSTTLTTPEFRATFGYGGVCVGPKPLSSDDDSVTRRQVNNDATGTAKCVPYAQVTNETFADTLVVGNDVLAIACQQLASYSFGIVIFAGILTMVAPVACFLQNCRAVRMCCCGGKEGVKNIYNLVSRVFLLLILCTLVGGIVGAVSVSAIGSDQSLLLAASYSTWESIESELSGVSTSALDFTVRSDPEDWLGIYQVIPCAIMFFFGLILELITSCFKPEGLAPVLPCCCGRNCCCGDADELGFCGDALVSPDDCGTSCAPLSYSKRRTTESEADPWSIDWYRLCMLTPPTVGVMVAGAVIGVLAMTEPLFQYTATGNLYAASSSTAFERSVDFVYSLSMTQGCLSTDSALLPQRGYPRQVCFPIASPRQLALSPSANHTLPPTDFSLEGLVPAARIAQNYVTQVQFRATGGVAILVGYLLILLCNVRKGKGFRWYRTWGRVLGLLLIAFTVGDLIASVLALDAPTQISNMYLLLALKNVRVDFDDEYGQQLRDMTFPLAGGVTFSQTNLKLKSADGWDLLYASMGLAIPGFILFFPPALCGLCGTFRGARSTERPSSSTTTNPTSAAATTGGGGGSAARAIVVLSAGTPSEDVPDDGELRRRFGCLSEVKQAKLREKYQRDAEQLAEQMRQIKKAGLPDSIIDGLKSGQPHLVRRRADELMTAEPVSTPKAAVDLPPPTPPAFSTPSSYQNGGGPSFPATVPGYPPAEAALPYPSGAGPGYPSAPSVSAAYPSVGPPPPTYGTGGGGGGFAL
jgi:hypothetical protein